MLTQAIGGSHEQIDGKVNRGEIHPHPETLKAIQDFTRFGRSHLPYHPDYVEVLQRSGGKGIFLYRDPRDCIISWAHYADDVKGYKGFINFKVGENRRLSDLSISERIDKILRVAKFEYGRYVEWLDASDDVIHKMTYEDLLYRRKSTFQTLIDWMGDDLVQVLGTEFDCSTPEKMINRIDPANCNTYRKGTTGDWKNHFTSEQEEFFWVEMGEIMDKMGYD
jgi:hypothetical protein